MEITKNYCHYKSCNLETTQRCGGCQKVYYCSVEHQRLDWFQEGHKAICKKTQSLGQQVFPKNESKTHKAVEEFTNDFISIHVENLSHSPNKASNYFAIAFQLFPKKSTRIDDHLWSAVELLEKAHQLNPSSPGPFLEMYHYALTDGKVTFAGSTWTAAQLCIKAIELDSNYFISYHNLCVVIPPGKIVTILEKTWTKESLFNKAMELKPPEEENIPPFLPIRGFYVSEKERQEDLEEMKRSMDRSFQRDMEQMRRTHEANLEAAFAQWYKKA